MSTKKHRYKEENPHYEELTPEQVKIKDEQDLIYHEERPEGEAEDSNG